MALNEQELQEVIDGGVRALVDCVLDLRDNGATRGSTPLTEDTTCPHCGESFDELDLLADSELDFNFGGPRVLP